ncbi:MAG: hypothetical protein FJ050_00435 [Cyanobacteria bacterium M_surface_7_m2_040]|nr:hypothetical protein [Cyanobacteria bacterium K_Offshore_0m_m2_072]MBM5808572.1 hypothetical protein [Cyanobacteria bacterium M_surface_9_m1_291]MBM5826525.1 hypothetical protein [Cyanobacteria bacterium M_surface_7_m2_040]
MSLLLALAATAAAVSPRHSVAQSQQYMLGPGSNVGSQTKVEPKNCVTDAQTGAITCDTQLVNPPSDTPAKPSYTPFGN